MRVSRLATALECSNAEARARLESLFKLLPHMRRHHEQLTVEETAQLLEERSLKNLGRNLVSLKVLFPSLDVGRMVAGSEGLLAGPFEEVEAKLRRELTLLELGELAELEPLMQDYPEALDCILDEGELLLTDFWAVYQTDKDVRWRRESKLRAI